jgi:hypothetical protein
MVHYAGCMPRIRATTGFSFEAVVVGDAGATKVWRLYATRLSWELPEPGGRLPGQLPISCPKYLKSALTDRTACPCDFSGKLFREHCHERVGGGPFV